MKKKLLKLEKNNKELHFPGYHFCGPGTKVVTRLTSGTNAGKGINPLDLACMEHDINYFRFAGNDKELRNADNLLRERANKIGGLAAKMVDKVFFFKALAEKIGFWSPSSFAAMLSKNLTVEQQRELGNILYEKYIKNKDFDIENALNSIK